MPLLFYRKCNVLKLSASKCLYFKWRQMDKNFNLLSFLLQCPLLVAPLNVLIVIMDTPSLTAIAPSWSLPQIVMTSQSHYLCFDIYTNFLPDWPFAYSKLSFSFDPQLFPCATGLLFQIQTKLLSICSYIFLDPDNTWNLNSCQVGLACKSAITANYVKI